MKLRIWQTKRIDKKMAEFDDDLSPNFINLSDEAKVIVKAALEDVAVYSNEISDEMLAKQIKRHDARQMSRRRM